MDSGAGCDIADVLSSKLSSHHFRRVWPALKWVLFALLIGFVGRRAWQLWRDGDVNSVTISWPWLFAAAGLYLLGWLPSVWFWHRLIHRLGGSSNRWDVASSFFAGHLGKYVPGKASVLLIRAGMLAERGCRPGVAALTSTYETLVCMGVGAAVGLTLAPSVWPRQLVERLPNAVRIAFEHPLVFEASFVVVCVVLVPPVAIALGLLTRRLTRMRTVDSSEGASQVTEVEFRLHASFLLRWCFAFVGTWLIHGLSLGCTLRAVGVATSIRDWLTWTGDVSSASFLGFVAVFAPGGLGVREAALIELLQAQPAISAAQAVAASVLLRAAWLAAEIIAAMGLAWRTRRRTRREKTG